MTRDTNNTCVALVGAMLILPLSGIAQAEWHQRVELMNTSWYGPGYHRHRTASSVIFDQNNRHMAAHRTLPFGSKLWVQNLRTGRATWVIVVDRGPFVRGRDLDVSQAAAAYLGFQRRGHTNLQVTNLGHVPKYKQFFRGQSNIAMLP